MMQRSYVDCALCFILCMFVLLEPINASGGKAYSRSRPIGVTVVVYCFDRVATGIADIVRVAFKRGLGRFIFHQTSYDSDVFRYTQQSQRGYGGLYAGESCRLTPSICSHDEQCCSGRCLCRRWLITGEQRCLRKCF